MEVNLAGLDVASDDLHQTDSDNSGYTTHYKEDKVLTQLVSMPT